MNDPNGLVYNSQTKEYHLFYQYNPYDIVWGNMSWGHAISKNLVDWTELPVALLPDEFGNKWSGSAVIDYKNTSGLFTDDTSADNRMVLIVMNNEKQGESVMLAYSSDTGRTFLKYKEGAPVLQGVGDPKVIWYEDPDFVQGGIWLMIVTSGKLFSSENLINWKFVGNVFHKDGNSYFWECPDLYPLEVLDENGNSVGEIKWIYNAAGSWYTVGNLIKEGDKINYYAETEEIMYNGDSHQFTERFFPQYEKQTVYATQSYFNDPRGRRISVSWLRDESGSQYDASKVWNGYQSLPTETTLRCVDGRYRLHSYPVEEILEKRKHLLFEFQRFFVRECEDNILENVQATAFDIEAEFQLIEGTMRVGFGLCVNGSDEFQVYYDVAEKKMFIDKRCVGQGIQNTCQYQLIPLKENKIKLRIIVDSVLVEAFGNDGAATISTIVMPTSGCGMRFFVQGQGVLVDKLNIYSFE